MKQQTQYIVDLPMQDLSFTTEESALYFEKLLSSDESKFINDKIHDYVNHRDITVHSDDVVGMCLVDGKVSLNFRKSENDKVTLEFIEYDLDSDHVICGDEVVEAHNIGFTFGYDARFATETYTVKDVSINEIDDYVEKFAKINWRFRHVY